MNKRPNRKAKPAGKGPAAKTSPQKATAPETMRLNKYIAHCGIAARRKADVLIQQGTVKVNDQICFEPGYRVKKDDVITYMGKEVKPVKNLVYLLLNKPKNFITSLADEKGRKTVMQLVSRATTERIYPVGRLDRNTTGLLLFTNDGELAQKLTHPKHGVKKIYQAVLNKPLSKNDFDAIADGIELEDGIALVDLIAYPDPEDKRKVGLELHLGKNRIVRRIFEHLGYEVDKLDRIYFGGLTKKDLPRGRWRHLKEKEVIMLKHFI